MSPRACFLSPAQTSALIGLARTWKNATVRLEQDDHGRLDVLRLGPETNQQAGWRISPAGQTTRRES